MIEVVVNGEGLPWWWRPLMFVLLAVANILAACLALAVLGIVGLILWLALGSPLLKVTVAS